MSRGDHRGMNSSGSSSHLANVLACWNWKCALLSAAARSAVYAAAMARSGLRGSLGVVLVEVGYVTLTAGLYAGLQQKALGLRNRLAGNLAIVVAVPALAQALDWLTHRLAGASAPAHATAAVCIFAALSALYHLHIMRRGVFLSGHGHSLLDDFRRIPRLTAEFVACPALALAAMVPRRVRPAEPEAAL